jgi:hypothetical protein
MALENNMYHDPLSYHSDSGSRYLFTPMCKSVAPKHYWKQQDLKW